MGDFILYHKDRLPDDAVQAGLSCLGRQGSVNSVVVRHNAYVVHYFPKQLSPQQNFIADAHGNFCGSSGTFIYQGLMGEAALKSLLDDFTVDQYQPEDFNGIFTVIVKKNNQLYLMTDPMGGNRVYQNDRGNFWSSSFLAAASASARLTPDKQAIYEYAFQETTYGTDTVFNEVKCLDSLKIFEFTPEGPVRHDKKLDFEFQTSAASQSELVQKTLQLLGEVVGPVSRIFADKIHTALSGGYDSRLMLALLKDHGTTPDVYVYGSDNSPDVIIARTIAQSEGFPLDHIDKARFPMPSPEEYPDIVRNNFYALDGLPGESIFDFGANIDSRRNRADHGYMVFNGGGGEIFRNFFYLPDGIFTVTSLINCFYSRYSRIFCQGIFNEQDYRDHLHDKIRTALNVNCDHLSRTEIEYAYPAFRLRYWTARDNNNNSRLGPYLTPFMSYKVIRQALTIPLNMKNHGEFQAELIRTISPALAAYPSDYGYSFDQAVPATIKFKNYLNYYRPLFIRRYSYAIKARMRTRALPETLKPFFGKGCRHMAQYFKIDQITDMALLARIYTLEYLFEYFNL